MDIRTGTAGGFMTSWGYGTHDTRWGVIGMGQRGRVSLCPSCWQSRQTQADIETDRLATTNRTTNLVLLTIGALIVCAFCLAGLFSSIGKP
jgi:hypothetical protein